MISRLHLDRTRHKLPSQHIDRITFAKTLFTYKITFTGSSGWGLVMSFGDHHLILHRAQQYEFPEVSTLNSQSSSFLCHYLMCSVLFVLLSLVWEMFSTPEHACVESKDFVSVNDAPSSPATLSPRVQHSVWTQSTELSCRFIIMSTPVIGGQIKKMTVLETKINKSS